METLADLKTRLTSSQKRVVEIASQTGASNWLTTLPIEEKGFNLTKREFWDALYIRYSWPLQKLPTFCACGENFSLSHAFSCMKGGFVIQRHNELRDITADLLADVCCDVCVEPPLNQLTGETFQLRTANISADAKLDISARGVWTRNQRAFFDVRVFNPFAPTYSNKTLQQCYQMNEQEKKRAYNQRVLEVENGTFTPLVFSAAGGMANECSMFYKRLAGLISEKQGTHQSVVSTWLRTKLSFALQRSAVMCIRGTRHRYYKYAIAQTDMELDIRESTMH